MSQSWCVAVGTLIDKAGQFSKTLAESWDGSHWSIQPTPERASGLGFLSGVSCRTPSNCMAVGNALDSSGNQHGSIAESWNGHSWSLLASPKPAGDSNSALISVSCPSASLCLAVGGAATGSGQSDGPIIENWNGSSWNISPWSHKGLTGDIFLGSVDCPTVSTCVATGFQSTNDGPLTLAERFNGRGWSVQPTPVIPYGYDISPLAVACPTAERCLAAGGYVNNNLKVTLAETWRP